MTGRVLLDVVGRCPAGTHSRSTLGVGIPGTPVQVRPYGVVAAPGAVQDVVWNLGEGASVPRWERAHIVDRQARTLAAAFGDTEARLGFWRKLIWNVLRGIDAGCDLSDDVGAVLMTVLKDLQHDHLCGGTTLRNPADRANALLSRSQGGQPPLLDQLRCFEHLRVGSRPAA